MATLVTGALGCIAAWVCRRPLEEAWPSCTRTITGLGQALPFPSTLVDPGYQRALRPAPRTGLNEGTRRTLDVFAALKKAGRLDARRLEPPT